MKDNQKARSIIYSCSGCSSVAQLANHLALRADREQLAEMSCIAGVGAGVKPLVHKARSGRPLIAIDGCALACARACLAQQGLLPQLHIELSQMGIRKLQHQDFDAADAERMWVLLQEKMQELSIETG